MDNARRIAISLLALALVGSCDTPEPTEPLAMVDAQLGEEDGGGEANRRTLPTSLHATAAGMRFWYERPDGFGPIVGAAYEGLSCAGCHVAEKDPESCDGCHDTPLQGRGSVRQETCLSCHSRQASEIQMGLADVHRDAGLECWDCHTSQELHGDGTAYESMFQPGAMEVTCTRCHGVPGTRAHQYHGQRIACVTCHMASSVTCINCHFAKELEAGLRVAAGKVAGWQFLGNYRGQVYPLNFQSLEYQGNTFVAWGPYTGHTIVREGLSCAACHASANLADLQDDGTIRILRWDPLAAKLMPAQGVIPVPPDFATSLSFDFVALQPGGSRSFLESGPDATTMLFAQPLSSAQLDALAVARDEHEPVPGGPPLCDGLPATIWVGMSPAQLPPGASIVNVGSDHDHGTSCDSHDAGSTGGHDGSCEHTVRWIIVGTNEADVIVGSTTPDSIVGRNGDDLICGLQARDHIYGGNGQDRVFGGAGADFLYGEDGDDFVEGGAGWDRIRGGRGSDRLFGNEGQDSIFGELGDDFLFGGKSPDFLDGGPGTNLLEYGPEICEGTPGEGGSGHTDSGEDGCGCGDDHTDHTHAAAVRPSAMRLAAFADLPAIVGRGPTAQHRRFPTAGRAPLS